MLVSGVSFVRRRDISKIYIDMRPCVLQSHVTWPTIEAGRNITKTKVAGAKEFLYDYNEENKWSLGLIASGLKSKLNAGACLPRVAFSKQSSQWGLVDLWPIKDSELIMMS